MSDADLIISRNAEETRAFGRTLGAHAEPGDVFALTGELGAGKTQLAKGIVEGLGDHAPVTSPTFTLLHEYEGGRLPIYHFDFYRLEDAASASRLALEDYLEGTGVCVVEWADRFPDLFPPGSHWFTISSAGDGARRIERARRR